jgi:hypothetical protein
MSTTTTARTDLAGWISDLLDTSPDRLAIVYLDPGATLADRQRFLVGIADAIEKLRADGLSVEVATVDGRRVDIDTDERVFAIHDRAAA